MNKRIYKKDVNCFLKQPFHENILPKLQSTKKNSNRRKRPLSNNSLIKADEAHSQPSTPLFGKLRRIKEVELEASSKFLNKDVKSARRTALLMLAQRPPQAQTQAGARSYPYKAELHFKADTALLLSIEQVRNVLVSKRMERQTRSELRDKILESRKVRFLYGGLSKKELKKSIERSKQLSGNTGDNLFVLLESRLDVVLERCGFFSSIQAARQSVVHKRVYLNSRIVTKPGCQLKSGDVIQVYPSQPPLPFTGAASKKRFLEESVNKSMSIQAQSKPVLEPNVALQTEQTQAGCACNPNAIFKGKAFTWAFTAPPAILRSLSQLESVLSALGEAHSLASAESACAVRRRQANLSDTASYVRERLPRIHKNKSNTTLSDPNLNASDKEIWTNANKKNTRFECFSREQINSLTPQLAQIVESSELNNLLKDEKKLFNFTSKEVASQSSAFGLEHRSGTDALFFYTSKENGFSCSADNNLSLHFGESYNAVLAAEERKKQGFRAGKIHVACAKHSEAVLACAVRRRGRLAQRSCASRWCAYRAIVMVEKMKSRQLNLGTKEKIVDMLLSDSFYNTHLYWLEVKKRLLSHKNSEEWKDRNVTEIGLHKKSTKDQIEVGEMASFWNSSNLIKMIEPLFSTQRSFQERKSKPLHIELSYQSHTAIFLYAPQRVYLAALVDVDLLIKSL